MGVASGMPAKASWLPLLLEELPEDAHWQAICIGRTDVWDVHQKTAELGGHFGAVSKIRSIYRMERKRLETVH